MRILHVIETLEFGGAEQVVVHLANKLAEHHEITLCLVKYRGELLSRLSDEIDVVCLDLGDGIHFDLPGKLSALIREREIDILHLHNWALFLESWLAARIAGHCPMLLTIHGPYTVYGNSPAQRLKKYLRHLLERLTCRTRQVIRLVPVSDAIGEYIVSDIGIPRGKLQTIHNGIARVEFEAIEYDGEVEMISVGRLAAVKNHRLMIDALAMSLEKNPRLSLSLVGDGPERAALERYVSDSGLDDKVRFLGFRSDITELLARHDIFLLSSDYEGISIALLESMSLSRPAIATAVGGIPETIEDGVTGIIVPRGDVRAYSQAMLRLAASPGLRLQMGVTARKYFETDFHEDIVVGKYLELYRQGLPDSGGRAPRRG